MHFNSAMTFSSTTKPAQYSPTHGWPPLPAWSFSGGASRSVSIRGPIQFIPRRERKSHELDLAIGHGCTRMHTDSNCLTIVRTLQVHNGCVVLVYIRNYRRK